MKLEEELLQYLAYNTNQITRCSAQNVLRGSSVVRHRRSGQTCLMETLRTLLFFKCLNSLHPALISCKMKREVTQLFKNKQRKKKKSPIKQFRQGPFLNQTSFPKLARTFWN